METNKEKSKCCGSEVRWTENPQNTGYFYCSKCGLPLELQDKEVLKQELIGLVRENVKIIEKYTNHIAPQVDKQLSQCNDCFDGDCCNGKVDGCTYHCCVKDKQQDIREEFIDDGYRIHYVKNGEDVGIVTEYKHAEYGHLFPKFLSQSIEQELKEIRNEISEIEETRQISKVLHILDKHINNHDNN